MNYTKDQLIREVAGLKSSLAAERAHKRALQSQVDAHEARVEGLLRKAERDLCGLHIYEASSSEGKPVCISTAGTDCDAYQVCLFRDPEGLIVGVEVCENGSSGQPVGRFGLFPAEYVARTYREGRDDVLWEQRQ